MYDKTDMYDVRRGIQSFTYNYTVPAVGPLNATQNTVPSQDEPDGRFWLVAANMTYSGVMTWNLDFVPTNGTTAEDGSYVVVHTEKDECPDPAADNFNGESLPSRLALGGWCQKWQGNCHWDTSTASIVLAGGFSPDCRVMPDKSPSIPSSSVNLRSVMMS